MRCSVTDEWSTCNWVMEVVGEYDSNNKQKKLVCSTGSGTGATCNNHGGSDDLDVYASGIQLSASDRSCDIRISNSDAIHGNKWTCTMQDDPLQPGAMQ